MAVTVITEPSHSTTLTLPSPSLGHHETKPPHNHPRPNEEDLGKEQLLPSTSVASNTEFHDPTPDEIQQHQKYLYLYNQDLQRKEIIARLTRDLKKSQKQTKKLTALNETLIFQHENMKKLAYEYTNGMAEFSHLAKSKLEKRDKFVKEVVDVNAKYETQANDLRARLKQKERDVFRLEKCLSAWKVLTSIFLLLAIVFFHYARPSVCMGKMIEAVEHKESLELWGHRRLLVAKVQEAWLALNEGRTMQC